MVGCKNQCKEYNGQIFSRETIKLSEGTCIRIWILMMSRTIEKFRVVEIDNYMLYGTERQD